MDSSSAAAEMVTLCAAAGYVVHFFPTGQGNVIGNPILPVIKLCANPRTVRTMSRAHRRRRLRACCSKEMNPDQAGDELLECMFRTANGRLTAAEALGHREFVLTRLVRIALEGLGLARRRRRRASRSSRCRASPSQTVLDVVTHIQRALDPTLAYRFACRVGMCGSCAMTVNGVPRWTCRTHVDKVARDDRLEIGPLRNLPVIRDLVTDMREFFDKWARAQGQFQRRRRRAATTSRA